MLVCIIMRYIRALSRLYTGENKMGTIEENIVRFGGLISQVNRPGINELMNWLRTKTDFYTAPASTAFHLACEGGLLQHSLNVYDCLVEKRKSAIWSSHLAEVSDESLIIMALFHDLCKVNFYKKSFFS